MKQWHVCVEWDLNQNIPAPIPSGFKWTAKRAFVIKSDDFPTFREIKNMAIRQYGASSVGFTIVSPPTVLPDNFFTDPEIPVEPREDLATE